jgi:hypothetical protein
VIRNAGLGEFLRSRRARLDPAQAGLTSAAGRRVPGLRREELARLAGLARITTPGWNRAARRLRPGAVLAALAAALQLDGAERLHLYGFARTAAAPACEAGRDVQAVRPATYRLMELLAEAPAILLGRAPTSSPSTTPPGPCSPTSLRCPPASATIGRLHHERLTNGISWPK